MLSLLFLKALKYNFQEWVGQKTNKKAISGFDRAIILLFFENFVTKFGQSFLLAENGVFWWFQWELKLINPFAPNAPFSNPWKYQKTFRFSDVFRG